MDIMKEVKRKPYKNELLQMLLSMVDEDDDLRLVIDKYWKDRAEENEEFRFSDRSKEAFDFLRKVYKYHEYQRRDGAIINRVKDEEGNVVIDEKEVHKLVLSKLQSIQVKDGEPKYDEPIPFPKLGPPSRGEMFDMLHQLSTGKATAFDGVTDVIFEKVLKDEVAEKLEDIWDTLANETNIMPIHFDLRLIPLNKVYPKVPKPQECRPIIVSSPLVKLLEVRVKRKLERYMVENLICSQTGFVPQSGIDVNQTRLVDRVRIRTAAQTPAKRTHVFGLFLDFSSAYNTVLHSRLFAKLEKVLSLREIELIKAIYSRSRIRLGEQSFTPNIGVAQGSVISPALFNVYCEDLYENIRDLAFVCEDDMLGYADDLLILVTSLSQLRQVISIVRLWCQENNLKINAQKSGILEFMPRAGPSVPYLQIGSCFEGFPIVDKYKYLGVWVDSKLTLDPQLKYIKDKVSFLSQKLWPLLKCVSLDYRINLWRVFVRPLFEMVSSIYVVEGASNKEKVIGLLRKTFKSFTLLCKNVDNQTVEELMNFDFSARATASQRISRAKWEARKSRSSDEFMERKKRGEFCNGDRNVKGSRVFYPKELQELINMKTALCPKCNVPCSSVHMWEVHRVFIPSNEIVLEKCNLLSAVGLETKSNRKTILETIAGYITPFSVYMKHFLAN